MIAHKLTLIEQALNARLVRASVDCMPCCEQCGKRLAQMTTIAYAPFCSARCESVGREAER